MPQQIMQFLMRSILLLLVLATVSTSARSTTHFGETNQINQEQDGSSGGLIDSGLTPLQLEMLAQRLSEYNQIPPIPAAWERLARNPEVKRQSRYRQCYFNPISCFRK
ncbi:uncharacterized protein LOC116178673 [Photinus pyralis]|nr:uncharacterized protein LOC116178673 [Photinus pyralis]